MDRSNGKPDFAPVHAMWIDDEFLPHKLTVALRKEIPASAMDEKKIGGFLRRCAGHAHHFHECGTPEPVSAIVGELEKVAANARRLLASMRALSPDAISTFNAHFDYLAFGSNPPVQLCEESKQGRLYEGRFLSLAWDVTEDLMHANEYSVSECSPDRTSKPKQNVARGLVYFIALEVRAVTGHRPPYSKETWFPKFMALLGAHLGFPCGRALVESVIKEQFPDPT